MSAWSADNCPSLDENIHNVNTDYYLAMPHDFAKPSREDFLICLQGNDSETFEGCMAYWAMGIDGKWVHTVKTIAEMWGIESWEVSKRVSASSAAHITSLRCTDDTCQLPWVAKNRTELLEHFKRRDGLCPACLTRKAAEDSARRLQRYEEEMKRQATEDQSRRMKAALLQVQAETIWDRETSDVTLVNYWGLDYKHLVFAYTLLSISDTDGDLGLKRYAIPPLAPTPDAEREVITELQKAKVLQFSRKTPIAAFEPSNEPGTFTYHPSKILWRFGPPHTGASLEQTINKYVEDPIDDADLWETVHDVWWMVARTETRRYLDEQLDRYGLRYNDGDALTVALDHTLMHFSLPKARNILWMVAKDTGAYSARVDVIRPQAINSIPGAINRKVDRAVSHNWSLTPYVRKWDEEECALITTLFDRVLKTGRSGFESLNGKSIQVALDNALGEDTSSQDTFQIDQ